ncbi:hypothetical protein BABINDRAFT_162544 [Babjeviella inositovora NRRL Y-12698]|uniref:Uncharacterized protein n=1 Tax=Babjeviella inositovora NRRL Y-12698 TaxID=984486 RepID=A0A1E3QN42_9ASCO|nr:uncharacterized protein BABINDRAFT_162544 [Babjeviella inositovora NRRL Y-12698]ODQ78874.1 hypothetical protein BABINDRAFT_162544 [Babjeviella inositovora NRRL Y-12698]
MPKHPLSSYIPEYSAKNNFILFLVLMATVSVLLFHTRRLWLPRVRSLVSREDPYISLGAQLSFTNDIENGLSSASFDVGLHNLDDPRQGLDEESKLQILGIMKQKGVPFDKARLLHIQKKMRDNGIGEDGMPLDARAVRFV